MRWRPPSARVDSASWRSLETVSCITRAFPDHWAGPPLWSEVEFRLIDESGLASVGALLAGEVDLIDKRRSGPVRALRQRDDVTLATRVSNRVWYLFFDQFRDASPWITDRNGEPLARNPLKDPRVRRAISLAIDREFITQRLMAGQGEPVGDVAGRGVFGVNPALDPDPYDPQAARRLLAEAGYPTLRDHAPRLAGQILPRRDDAPRHRADAERGRHRLPARGAPGGGVLSPRGERRLQLRTVRWGSITGETSYTLRMLLCSPDPANGLGGANRGRYANPAFDALVIEAMRTLDDERRRGLLMKASAVAIADAANRAICSRTTTWAAKRGLRYEAQADGATLAAAAFRAEDAA